MHSDLSPERSPAITPSRFRSRRWFRGCALLAALACVPLVYRVAFVYALWPRPCATPTPSVPDRSEIASGTHVRVLTYNIEGHAALLDADHLRAIARTIVAQQPDVVALQEVHRGTWQSRGQDQAARLAALTGMQVVYGPSFRELGGEFGNALLTRGRVVAMRVVPLPSIGEPRSLLETTVQLPGMRLDVWVTHLAAWAGLNRWIRARQLQCVGERLRSAPRPVVLCGDFNGVVGEDGLPELAALGVVRRAGDLAEPTHRYLRRHIDYVYADRRFAVLRTAVLHTGPSDHWPVLADLAWTGGGAP